MKSTNLRIRMCRHAPKCLLRTDVLVKKHRSKQKASCVLRRRRAMPHSVQDVCRTSARIRFKFTYFESAFEILRSDNRRFASCTRSLLSVWPDVGVKKVVHMSPKVAQIVETTVLTYNDPFLRSLKCHHSFWATFVSKFVRLNFQNMPNLVTLSLFHPHLSLSVSLPLTHLYTSLFRVGSISLSLSLSLTKQSVTQKLGF